jgi:hypothetical protein
MRDRPPGKLRHRELDAFGLECDRDRPPIQRHAEAATGGDTQSLEIHAP